MLTLAFLTLFPVKGMKSPEEKLDFCMPCPPLTGWTEDGHINLSYNWTANEVSQLRQRHWTEDETGQPEKEVTLTGVEVRGFEALTFDERDATGFALHVNVSDGYYHLVDQDFPVDLDEIHKFSACDFADCGGFKENRNRFDECGPYYIRQTRNDEGDLTTHIICRKRCPFEQHLVWRYYTFGDTDGQSLPLHYDTIDPSFVGYSLLGTHPENTTLILEPGTVSLQTPGVTHPDYTKRKQAILESDVTSVPIVAHDVMACLDMEYGTANTLYR